MSPSNSNSDNSSFIQNKILESLNSNILRVPVQTVSKSGAGTLKPMGFSVLFAEQSLLLRLKRNCSRRLLVRIFDWEVRHHDVCTLHTNKQQAALSECLSISNFFRGFEVFFLHFPKARTKTTRPGQQTMRSFRTPESAKFKSELLK